MKTVLLICDKLQEINRIRRYFDASYVIKATNSPGNAVDVAANSTADLVLYHIGADYSKLFDFYRNMQGNEITKNLSVIIMADINIVKTLSEMVAMQNTTIVASSIAKETLSGMVDKMLRVS